MSKCIGIIIILLLLQTVTVAQKRINYPDVDRQTYELFQKKKWKDLIVVADEARKQGIDFFYLKVRSGIAYYNLKRYRIAAEWFLKAYEKEKKLEWLQEYLYYSLIFSGRIEEAMKIAEDFDLVLRDKIGFEKSKITRIAFEAGYSFNQKIENKIQNRKGMKTIGNDDYGEAFFFDSYYFEALDVSHRVKPGLVLNHNFTYLSIEKEQVVDWGRENRFSGTVNQYQYFVNLLILLKSKLYFSPSLTIIWGDYNIMTGTVNDNLERFFYRSNYKFSDIIISAKAWSNFGNIVTGAELNYADINNDNFAQLSTWLTIYPFSNLNFFISPSVYFKIDQKKGFNYNTVGVNCGVDLGKMYLTGHYYYGKMENFIESSGYVVSNFMGVSNNKLLLNLYFPTDKKFQFVIRAIAQDVDDNYRIYNNFEVKDEANFNFVKYTLTAGISWNF